MSLALEVLIFGSLLVGDLVLLLSGLGILLGESSAAASSDDCFGLYLFALICVLVYLFHLVSVCEGTPGAFWQSVMIFLVHLVAALVVFSTYFSEHEANLCAESHLALFIYAMVNLAVVGGLSILFIGALLLLGLWNCCCGERRA